MSNTTEGVPPVNGTAAMATMTTGVPGMNDTTTTDLSAAANLTDTPAHTSQEILQSTAAPTYLECSDPGDVANADRNVTSYSAGGITSYTCHQGYRLTSGDQELVCQTNGTWAGVLPGCTSHTDEILWPLILIFTIATICAILFIVCLAQDFTRYRIRKAKSNERRREKVLKHSKVRPGLFYVKISPKKLTALFEHIPPAHSKVEDETTVGGKSGGPQKRGKFTKSKSTRSDTQQPSEFEGYFHSETRAENVGDISDLIASAESKPPSTHLPPLGADGESAPTPGADGESAPPLETNGENVSEERPKRKKQKKKSFLKRQESVEPFTPTQEGPENV